MAIAFFSRTLSRVGWVRGMALVPLFAAAGSPSAHAQTVPPHFTPGNLVVSRSVYDNNAANVTLGEQLRPNCASSQGAVPACPAR